MKIRHERPMSDLEFKVRAPLRLELPSGEVVEVDEWSQAGITYPDASDVLIKRAHLIIPFQGVDIRFPVSFEAGTRENELVFVDLTGRQREVIGVFYRSILSGKMAPSEDMITALDTPVDLVPMGETEEEKSSGEAKQTPRALRVVWNIVFYVALAVALFGVIGGQIVDRVTSVSLKSARVVAPVVEHNAPSQAYVDEILAVPGQTVARGDVLVRLSDPARDSAVDDIRRDIARAADRVREVRAILNSHLGLGDQERARLLEILEKAVEARHWSDFTAGRNMQAVNAALAALAAFDAQKSRAPGDFWDLHKDLRDQLDRAKEDERRLRRDLGNAKDAAEAHNIIAQVDGTVSELLVIRNEYIGRGHLAVTVEEDRSRFVQAWLNEARSGAVYIGMNSDVVLRTVDGKKRHKAVVTDLADGIDPATDNGFGMIVTLELTNMDMDDTRAALMPGAPVQARALKSWFLTDWWRG